MVGHWHKLPRQVVYVPSLKMFKARLNYTFESKRPELSSYYTDKFITLCKVWNPLYVFGFGCLLWVCFFKIYFILVVLNFGLNYTNENLEKMVLELILFWNYTPDTEVRRSGCIILVMLLALWVYNMLSKREKKPQTQKNKHKNPSSSNQNKTPQKSQPKTQTPAFCKEPKPIPNLYIPKKSCWKSK